MNELSNSDEDKFLLQGIQEGFAITNIKKDIKTVHMDNYSSTYENREAVEKQIMTEIEEGRYVVVHLDLSRCPLLHKSLQPPP